MRIITAKMKSLYQLKKELKAQYNKEAAQLAQRFFKTGKGEYGEGDVFLGLKVPLQRKIAKLYTALSFSDVKELLYSKYHEFRFCALVILNNKFAKAKTQKERKEIVDFYLKHAKQVNNWDLVDISAARILGMFLLNKPQERKVLYKLAQSKNLWERRISIVATGALISNDDLKDAFAICELHLQDPYDLMHKACGWMLREAGKRDQKRLTAFLNKHSKVMPRTMLRYAIERYPEKERKAFLQK